jgi:hypothetical protein
VNLDTALSWHDGGAWALIATNAVAGAWALVAHRWPAWRGWPLWIAIVVAQSTTILQAVTGTILMTRFDLEPARLHALYGFAAVIAVAILFSYRTSSGMRGKEHVLYGVGSLFIMGLGLRELVLA